MKALKKISQVNKKLRDRRDKNTPPKVKRWADRFMLIGGVVALFVPVLNVPAWIGAGAAAFTMVGKYLSDYSVE